MNADAWKKLVIEACLRHGFTLTSEEEDQLMLGSNPSEVKNNPLYAKIVPALLFEVFDKAADGATFGPEEKLRTHILHTTVSEAFPDASPTFKDVLRAFLTLWSEYLEMASDDTHLKLSVLVFINEYKQTFHPGSNFMEPVPAALFESKQRRLLQRFGGQLDIEDYFAGNPLLNRSTTPWGGGAGAASKAGGCGCLLFVAVIPAAIWTVSRFVQMYI